MALPFCSPCRRDSSRFGGADRSILVFPTSSSTCCLVVSFIRWCLFRRLVSSKRLSGYQCRMSGLLLRLVRSGDLRSDDAQAPPRITDRRPWARNALVLAADAVPAGFDPARQLRCALGQLILSGSCGGTAPGRARLAYSRDQAYQISCGLLLALSCFVNAASLWFA